MELVEIIAEHIKAANATVEFIHKRNIETTEEEAEILTVEINKLKDKIEYLREKRIGLEVNKYECV